MVYEINFFVAVFMDMAVDIFFLLDLPLRFLMGVVYQGSIIIIITEVARHYLRTSFFLDFLAAVPVAWIEYATIPLVDCNLSDRSNNTVKYLRLIRLFRMIRIFKVPALPIASISSASLTLSLAQILRIFDVLRDLIRLRPNVIRLIKALFSVKPLINGDSHG
jgi:hypothetical protein